MNDYEVLLEPFYLQRNVYQNLLAMATSKVQISAKNAPSNQNLAKQAVIHVYGTMFRYENALTKFGYGVSTENLKAQIKSALNDGKDVLLVIDSGGGVVNGLTDLCEFVSSNKDRIEAFIKGVCASGALWLASSCGKITAEKTSLIGSLGVVVSVWDFTKAYEQVGIFYKDIVSTLSPNKRPDVLTDEGIAEVKRNLDALAELFIGGVASARGMSKDDIVEKLEKGGLITGVEALERGVIDAIDTLENLIRSNVMDKEKIAAEADAPIIISERKPDVEKGKLQALAMYRNLLSDSDFQAFMDNKEASADDVKNHILAQKVENAKPMPAVIVGDDLGERTKRKDVADAICMIGGIGVDDASNTARRLATQGRLKPILATLNGLNATTSDSEFMASMTTSDFPILLKEGSKRILDHGFEKAATTWQLLVNRVAHPDFRPYTSVARQGVPANVWQPIVEGGEPKDFTLSENGEVAKIESKAASFKITRQMLINDDLGAFTDMLSDFAQSANEHINACVYAFIETRDAYAGYKTKDGKPLFDASHNNKFTGAASALSEDALFKVRTAMARQKDVFGNKIRVMPQFLIVPPELKDTAVKLMVSSATLEANMNSGVKNILQGAYQIVSDPELENAKAWYLAAAKAINFGYLAETGGKPIIELADKSVVEGLHYQGVLDFAIYANKYQLIAQNVGA